MNKENVHQIQTERNYRL